MLQQALLSSVIVANVLFGLELQACGDGFVDAWKVTEESVDREESVLFSGMYSDEVWAPPKLPFKASCSPTTAEVVADAAERAPGLAGRTARGTVGLVPAPAKVVGASNRRRIVHDSAGL